MGTGRGFNIDYPAKAEAQDLVFPDDDWFNEDFDTANLKDAKSLLEELK